MLAGAVWFHAVALSVADSKMVPRLADLEGLATQAGQLAGCSPQNHFSQHRRRFFTCISRGYLVTKREASINSLSDDFMLL